MAGEKNFLRIPPDSTGKRIQVNHNAQIFFNNMTSGYLWKVGRNDYLLGDGWTIHVHGVYQETVNSGILDVSYAKQAVYGNLSPTAGTTIKDPDTEEIVAYVVSSQDIYVNATNIVGFKNPANGVDIDGTGSMNIRFAEGLPQLDSFGKLRVSGATLLGDYTFTNSILPDRFSSVTSHMGASITWESNKRAALLTIDDTAGSNAIHTTNTYHHYFPGSSHVAMMTLATGDAGKQNLTRAWGLFDTNNGFHFVQKDGRLGVSIKSDVTGTTEDMYFWQNPQLGESGWNGDQLDGTGESGMIIDTAKDNLYWIDAQWLGAGRVRFGVYYQGNRIVCHEYYHANTKPYPYSATASLPLTFGQINTGATGSSSEMRVFCASVWTETDIDVVQYGEPWQRSVDVTIPADNNVYHYMTTMSPVDLYSSGLYNHSLYFPTNLQIMAFDTVTGAPVNVEVEVKVEPVVSGLQFVSTGNGSTVEYDRGAYDTNTAVASAATSTYYGGGQAIYKGFVIGQDKFDLTNVYNNMVTGAVKNYASNGGFRTGNIATLVQGAQTTEITFTEGYSVFRETDGTVRLHDITINGGTTSALNEQDYYVKVVGLNKVELWANKDVNQPYTSQFSGAITLDGTHDSGTGLVHGFFGPRFYWSLIVKKYFGTNPARVVAKVGWKEIRQ